MSRHIRNTRMLDEKKSAPLGFRVDSITWNSANSGDPFDGGSIAHITTYVAGQRPREVDVTHLDGSSVLTAKTVSTYARPFEGRLVTGSLSYYVYGLDRAGNLKQWTRYINDAGKYLYANPKLIARNMGGLRALSLSWAFRIGGVRQDVLYGTTKAGALKQFQIPWLKPGRTKITTLRTTGFHDVTGLSLSGCNNSLDYASIIAVDRTHNKARWYTLRNQTAPRQSNLVRRPLVAPGANWRLHAVY